MTGLHFAAFGTPRTKQSARFARGRIVSVAQANGKLKLYTGMVRQAVAQAAGDDPEEAARLRACPALDLRATFYFATKDDTKFWLPYTRRIDLDNLLKALMDAMQKSKLLRDDSQVAFTTLGKQWGPRAGVRTWLGEHGSTPDD